MYLLYLVLDSYDVAQMRRCSKTSTKYQEASNILAKENPNYPHNPNSAEGLEGENLRFVAFNGGIGATQLEWLQETLHLSREAQEKVVIISHQPILPGSSSSICLVWNYNDVLEILRDFSDIVVASFAGHAHSGGYKRDEQSGIHFRTFEAVLENPHPYKTYAMVEVHNECLVVKGYGNCDSAIYDFSHLSLPVRTYTNKFA
jgi:manganese-dependent ADP-ribose/CDP-alcohol diphosphatase